MKRYLSAGGETRIVVDGVAYAPHLAIDVKGWGVDWYGFSVYKTWGPHMAALYGSHAAFQDLKANPPPPLTFACSSSSSSSSSFLPSPLLLCHLLLLPPLLLHSSAASFLVSYFLFSFLIRFLQASSSVSSSIACRNSDSLHAVPLLTNHLSPMTC